MRCFILIILACSTLAYYEGGQWQSFISEEPLILTWPLEKAYPGIEYNIRLGVVGGKYPYTFYIEQAPDGMAIDSNGEITWTPGPTLEGQSFSVGVKAIDSLGHTVYQDYDLQVTTEGFYFVSPSGNDANTGTIEAPFRTMNHAISQGSRDDILYVRDGTYYGKIETGNINKWIAFPGEKPVFDLELTVISPSGSYGLIDGFEITNIKRWALSFNSESDYIVRRNHMHHLYDPSTRGNPSFIFFWDGTRSNNIVIQDNLFHDLFDRGSGLNGDMSADYHGSGITLYDVGYSLVEDNVVYNIDGHGFHDKDDTLKATYRGNYIYDVHGKGITISNQYTAYNIEILYNIVGDNTDGLGVGGQPQDMKNIDVHHNTINGGFHKNSGTLLESAESDFSLHFYDNILYYPAESSGYYPYRGHNDPLNVYKDYNLIYNEAEYIEGLPWKNPYTKDEWLALGFDVNSVFADPEFENGFALADDSPACRSGYGGSDIGAVPCGTSTCGDGSCNSGETCTTCQLDCGECQTNCGDGSCTGEETCLICELDCGECASVCGNTVCENDESCGTCQTDCGPCSSSLTVDSTYPGYDVSSINDGVIDAHGKEATTWASSEQLTDHWIEFTFNDPVMIGYVDVYWAYNDIRQEYMNAELEVTLDNAPAGTMEQLGEPDSSLSFEPVIANALRLRMPAGMGHSSYNEVLWVTEINYGISRADTDDNGAVSISELIFYIDEWQAGSVMINDIMNAIKIWKN